MLLIRCTIVQNAVGVSLGHDTANELFVPARKLHSSSAQLECASDTGLAQRRTNMARKLHGKRLLRFVLFLPLLFL